MDVNELIDNLRMPSWHDLEDPDATLLADAADALSTLQAENEKLRAELGQAKQERNAAVEDLRVCSIENNMECQYCLYRTARSFCWNCTDGSNWQWRGPHKED